MSFGELYSIKMEMKMRIWSIWWRAKKEQFIAWLASRLIKPRVYSLYVKETNNATAWYSVAGFSSGHAMNTFLAEHGDKTVLRVEMENASEVARVSRSTVHKKAGQRDVGRGGESNP